MTQTAITAPIQSTQIIDLLRDHTRDEADILPLIPQCIDINEAGFMHYTILHHAVIRDFPLITRYLLTHGANPNAPSMGNVTPLHKAAHFNRTDLIPLLLKHGAEVSVQDQNGRTPLHEYATNLTGLHDETISNLLTSAPDFNPNLRNNEGDTPLDLICREHSPSFAWDLVAKGARISFHSVYHSDIGERYLQAQRRWEAFESNPDVARLTHADLYLFANVGELSHAFTPELWRDYPAHLHQLFNSLPNYLRREVLAEQPALIDTLNLCPTPTVEGWSVTHHTAPKMPEPAR